jgi:nucleoid-associated protein YgaU
VIIGSSYTVVKNDSLWKISVRAYGDGFKWTEIAQNNNIANPGLIHPGNTLTLPR